MHKSCISLLETALEILKEKGSSDDIAWLFMSADVEVPSLLHDFLMEIGLAANSNKEVGLTCYSIEHIEKALKEVKETGSTNLLEEPRN